MSNRRDLRRVSVERSNDGETGMSYPVERHHRDQDVVGVYLNEIGRHRLLTKDDEARLGALIEAGAKARACLTSGEELTGAERHRLQQAVYGGGDRVARV